MQSSTPVVHTTSGPVRGKGEDVTTFKGIPFAEPPVGLLRWRPPIEKEPWTAPRDATEFAPDSVQVPDPKLRGRGMSEDCLYLNIWAPVPFEPASRPVLVWIHGNGYTRGSGSLMTYDGQRLAELGVVLVTVNYRLGLAGFLAHPALVAESEHGSAGNYGILDQIAALRWIKRNICQFGGDPERVTVFGQSAGGTCTSLLMASPLARGLFGQAILHSPGSMRPMAALVEAAEAGRRLGDDLAILRSIPAAELLDLAALLIPKVRKLASPRGMGPIVDGWAVLGDDITNYRSGAILPMPLMVGTTSEEGRRLADRFSIKTAAQLQAYTNDSFGGSVALPASYRAGSDAEVPAALERVVGDTQFNYGAWSSAREMGRLGGPVFRYLFTQPHPVTGLPPTHDDELPYVFGTLETGGIRSDTNEPFGAADQRLSAAMMRIWARFAATGSPDGVLHQAWPAGGHGSAAMELSSHPAPGVVPRIDNLEFLKSYFGH